MEVEINVNIIKMLTSLKFWAIAVLVTLVGFIINLMIARDAQLLNTNWLANDNPEGTQIREGLGATGSQTEFMKIEDCLDLPWDQLNGCYDKFLKEYGQDKEILTLLADLEGARAVSDVFENSCHPMAHAIGRLSLERYGNVGDAFENCDFSCHSGCYHGVMERMFFTDNEILEGTQHLSLDQMKSRVPGICDEKNFRDPTQSVIFQCLHGVGHAILYTMDYNLPEALKACDLLADDYQQSSCYGGVIMENVTAFDRDKRYIKQDDPHYPCNILDSKYQYDCYQMQTSVMLELGVEVEEQGIECLKAGSNENIRACHVSVGRDLSNYVRSGNSYFVADVCQQDVSGTYTENCIAGAAYALIDNTWDGRYAYELCNALRPENQARCYSLANSYMTLYSHNFGTVEGQCDQYAEDNVSLCKENINSF